ncbi:ATP-binding protein [Candidatus Allofournierella merdipullorum]|uniref:ATP-binding protein n=1 Tax=Candidatus Allofournierella merdipullorum TaxID=2838595 RepID=UPI00374FA6A5
MDTIKYKRDFRKQHPDFFDPSGILVFCGPQGAGKTLSAVQYVRKLAEKYPKMILVTNVEIKGLSIAVYPYTGIADFSKYSNGFDGVVYLIDEIHIEFNSLESKNIDPSVMTEIAQQRKQRKHIVGTSQVFGRIAKPFREQFKYVVLCRCLWGVLQYNTLIDGERAMVDDDGHLEAETVKRYFWWHKPELYDSYNTYAKIIRSKDRRIQSGYSGGN